jgi:DNA-directed RNA polymerase subunit alpha
VDKPSSLTFDTQNEGVIQVGDDGKIGAGEAEKARNRLVDALKIVLSDGYQPTSIVTEVAGAQSLSQLAPDDPMASELRSLGDKMDALLDRTSVSIGSLQFIPDSPEHLLPRTLFSDVRIPIEDLDLTVRTYNILKREGIETVADIAELTLKDLATFRNMGVRQVNEVKAKLQQLGLDLKGSA